MLPVIAFVSIVILIVRAHSYSIDIGDIKNIPISSSAEYWDVFCYVKSSIILFISVWAGLTLAFLLITGQIKIKRTYIYIPMLVYTIGVIASYLFSDYKNIAWMGSSGRFEGTRTLLCYMFMLFYTINAVDELKEVVIIVVAAAASVFLTCLVGITQLFGCDFFLTEFGKFLITGSSDLSIKAQFAAGQVYQTVGNMNYVGMYLAMLVPSLIYGLYYFISNKNKYLLLRNGIDNKKRYVITALIGSLLLLVLLNVYGAHSLGGLLGIGIAILILLITFCNRKWMKAVLTAATLVFLSGALTVAYIHGEDNRKQIDYIETDKDFVWMSIDGNAIGVIYQRETGDYSYCDSEGNTIVTFWFADAKESIRFEDARFGEKVAAIPFNDVNGTPGVILNVLDKDNVAFAFLFYEDGSKYINPYGQEITLSKVEHKGFDGHLSAGSGRAYIWSRTIPLLNKCWITGYGADTFMLVFPHSDYAGKYSIGSFLESFCDKAHNMYLNMAIGTGIISLIAFIAIMVMAMWKTFHLGNDRILVKIISAGLIGFLVAGMFYDSSVCTMPMFIGLLGTTIAIRD